MRFNGQQVLPPPEHNVVIPRPDGDFVFKMRVVTDFEAFDAVYPIPEPPFIQTPGQDKPSPMLTHPKYIEAVEKRGRARLDWLILQSLSATPELAWDNVKMDDPSTFHLYGEELKSAGFTAPQVNRIIAGVFEVNGMDQDKIEQAQKRFLAGQAKQ